MFKKVNTFLGVNNQGGTLSSTNIIKHNMKLKKITQKHPFHLVDTSPWPLAGSLAAFFLTFGGVMYMHSYKRGGFLLSLGFLLLLFTMYNWWRDIVREATFEGHHTSYVQVGLRIGMILFILSEVMFFFAFFWAYFHSSLAPVISLGCVWPPKGIEPISPWGIPLANTIILLSSGATVTWAHHALVAGNKKESIFGLGTTIGLALFFIALQLYEYTVGTSFTISTGIYGSVFFMITGFHGFHVIIGACCLIVCFIRLLKNHFTKQHHLGFETSAWYWHFVDVVWLFVFIFIYWWGGK